MPRYIISACSLLLVLSFLGIASGLRFPTQVIAAASRFDLIMGNNKLFVGGDGERESSPSFRPVSDKRVSIPMGPDTKPFDCALPPLFANSEIFTVTYSIPFGLNVEKPPPGFPAPIVTKDSAQEGSKHAHISSFIMA